MKLIIRFDLLTTDLVTDNQYVTKICSQPIETSYSFHANRSKVSENTTINVSMFSDKVRCIHAKGKIL